MKHDHTAYCFEFDARGKCVTCGEPRKQLDSIAWPKDTWHQQRLAKILEDRANELRKVQS